jgi:23S rRNA pseudouridine1911/1915/1917 synthase
MLEILHEDEWLIAVDKPAGMVVHPTYRNVDGTLLDELRARHSGDSLAVVGRLDKLTSGVVLLAKSAEIHAALQKYWHAAEKDYLAIVDGDVGLERGEIELPLGTDPADRRRRMVRPDGAPSLTRFERLAHSSAIGRSLLRCRLVTGRRHQIRVHLAARGWPIVGDALYGTARVDLARHALHAWRLSLRHPASRVPLGFEAPVPKELVSLYPNSDTVAW